MQTSTNGIDWIDLTEMDSDQDNNQNDAGLLASNCSQVQASIHEVARDPKIQRLSLEERLGRLSKYRIRPTSIKTTANPNGRGGKADVFRASFKRNKGARGKRVALKKLRWPDTTDEEKFSKEFVHEVELLAKLSHNHIVQLVGFVEDFKHQKAWIVLSWEPNGNVREFLASGKWEIPERISLIQDMFRGLQYLHTRQPPICHGDLKSLNILVNGSYHAVITDFGSSRVLRQDGNREAEGNNAQHFGGVLAGDEGGVCPEVTVVASANQLTLTGPAWSLRWAAPELVEEEEQPSLASDIWSAGWVCWEMVTDKVPFEDLKRDCAITLKVIQGEVPLVQKDEELAQVIALCSLMTDCWKYKPEERPHVAQCCNDVEWMPSVPPLGGTCSSDKELSPTLLLQMGRMHHSQGRHEKAVALFEKVVNITESAVPQEVLARALKHLGDVHRIQCKDTEAEESYIRAQEIYSRIGNDRGRADAISGLGLVYYAQRKDAEAEKLHTQAQEIYSRIGNDRGRADALDALGDVRSAQCKDAEAEEAYTRAQEIYARIGNHQGRANTLYGLGEVHRDQCKYAEAQESAWPSKHNPGTGSLYYAQRKYVEAEEFFMRAQEIYARIDDHLVRANTLDGLGNIHRAQCKYTEAEESYTRAQEIYIRIVDNQGLANTLRGLGHLYMEQDRGREAAQFYAKARDLFTQLGNSRHADDAAHWLARALDEGDPKDIALRP